MANTVTTKIVNLIASLTLSPSPSTLQQSGAIVSVGGTTLTTGAFQYCGDIDAVTALLGTSGNFAELTNMATTFFSQGAAVGLYVLELGTHTTASGGIAALNTWIQDNPGIFYAYLTPAAWDTMPAPAAPTLTSTAGGTMPAATYYVRTAYVDANGNVGALSPEATIAVITDDLYNVASPAAFAGAVSYNIYASNTTGTETLQNTTPIAIGTPFVEASTGLVAGTTPPITLAQLCSDYSAPTSKTYFYGTSSSVNIVAYGTMAIGGAFAGYKAAVMICPSPAAQSGEFQAAAPFYDVLVNQPGANNKLSGMGYRYAYGVTPWPQTGYTTEINTILSAFGNIIRVPYESGISQACIYKGTTSSGVQISNWYGVDWLQIQMQQAVAAAVVNGSNSNPPLLYDQHGINTLEAVAQGIADNAVTNGCALSATVSAIPFYTYAQQNPDDYASGIYNGLSCDMVGQNQFLTLTFYLNVSEFVAA